MALVSPGVQVTIIDQSQYLPAASNSVPLVLLATAQNKANAAGTGVAAATTATTANKLYLVTSQRDLINLYGSPFFYKTTNGTPIQGYELNEYGLLAAYSVLGITNRAYVLRADIDLASLVGQISRPTSPPIDGTYWLDTTKSTWGIYEFTNSGNTGKFTMQDPIVITNSIDLDSEGFPLQSIGNIGDYAVNAIYTSTTDPLNQGQYFHKDIYNTWTRLGTDAWQKTIPTFLSNVPTSSLTGGVFNINFNGQYTVKITIGGSTVQDAANAINALNLGDINAGVKNNSLAIYSSNPNQYSYLIFSADSSSSVSDLLPKLGMIEGRHYYQPVVEYGTSSQMPLWTNSQDNPRPTGSVWIKTSVQGNGLSLSLSQYRTDAGSFVSKSVKTYTNLLAATYALDATGGQAIPQGTVVGDYSFTIDAPGSPIYFYERKATGPTVVTGTTTNPTFVNGAKILVSVSIPNSDQFSRQYPVVMPNVGLVGPQEFVTAWAGAGIPYTKATVTSSGAIQLTHTAGGSIYMAVENNNSTQPIVYSAGFHPSNNTNTMRGAPATIVKEVVPYSVVDKLGNTKTPTGGIFYVTGIGKTYFLDGVKDGGSGYAVGDRITINGVQLAGFDGTHDLVIEVTELEPSSTSIKRSPGSGVAYVSGSCNLGYYTVLSNWTRVAYVANEGAPYNNPANKTNWFYSVIDQVDIMVQQQGAWKGYRNVAFDSNGHPVSPILGITPSTDTGGPIVAALAPTKQSDGITNLVYGDLWIDSADLENYPSLHRWQKVEGVDQWVKIDITDQTSQNGVLFADARWGTDGDVDPVNDPIPRIDKLLTSNYLDLDAPSASAYPQGMLLFNTRRSGYNVKQFRTNYFTAKNYPDTDPMDLPTNSGTWVTASGLKPNGAAYMGRKAQRNMVVQALKAAIGTNMSIREEDTFFNLIVTPNYPELQPDMVGLNNERNNTAYILGDTPLRLADQATGLVDWANNNALATTTGEDGLVTRDEYMGIFYPSGITTDLTGAQVVVPSSHMMLRTFIRNDQVAYPWLAAAGTRRGTIDNATNIGYLDATTGEFQVVKNRVGIRDVLYTNQINPLAFFTGVGLLNYGNKNSKDTQSALDRTNVARLICYIRERLQVVARPFIFEPNDALTRSQLSSIVQTLFVDLVSKRGLYDYLVVCDASNNTPAIIDRNELHVDIAIEPVKAAEFIYIPVRVLNTGGIANLGK